jgi:hypothetical protein
MITESIEYLRNSEDWVRTVLIGGVLGLLSFLLVPAFAVTGYLMRVLRATMAGEETPPVFEEWGDIVVDGLKATVIGVVYSFVPGVIGAVVVAFGVAGAIAGGDSAAGALGGLVAIGGLLVAAVLSVVAAYLLPAALANYAETGRLGAGFALGDLRPVWLSGTYATGWLYALAVLLAGGLVAGALNVVPFVGFVAGAFVTFYAAVAAAYIVGHTWADVHPVRLPDGDPMPEERPAV